MAVWTLEAWIQVVQTLAVLTLVVQLQVPALAPAPAPAPAPALALAPAPAPAPAPALALALARAAALRLSAPPRAAHAGVVQEAQVAQRQGRRGVLRVPLQNLPAAGFSGRQVLPPHRVFQPRQPRLLPFDP